MSFYRPALSGQKPVVLAFVFVCSRACRVFAGCCVNVAHGFFSVRLAFVLLANTMDVGGAESALDPLALDSCLELRDAAVEGLFFWAVMALCAVAAPPPPPLFRPKMEGRADLISARSFLISLCWLVADQALWLSVPCTI